MKYKILYTNMDGGFFFGKTKKFDPIDQIKLDQIDVAYYIFDKNSNKRDIVERLDKIFNDPDQKKYKSYFNDLDELSKKGQQIDFYTDPKKIVGKTILIEIDNFKILGNIERYIGGDNLFENNEFGIFSHRKNLHTIKTNLFNKYLNVFLPDYNFSIKNDGIESHNIVSQKDNKEKALNSLSIAYLLKFNYLLKFKRSNIKEIEAVLLKLKTVATSKVFTNEVMKKFPELETFVIELVKFINDSFFTIDVNKSIFTNLYIAMNQINKYLDEKFNLDLKKYNDFKLQKFIFTSNDANVFQNYRNEPPTNLNTQNDSNRLKLGQFVQFYYNKMKIEGIITFVKKEENDIYKITLSDRKIYTFDNSKYDTIFNILIDKSVLRLEDINLDRLYNFSQSICKEKDRFVGKLIILKNKNNNTQTVGMLVNIKDIENVNECKLVLYELKEDGFVLNDSFNYNYSSYEVRYSSIITRKR